MKDKSTPKQLIGDTILFSLVLLFAVVTLLTCSSCTSSSISKRGIIYTSAYDTITYQSTYIKAVKK